MTDVTPHVLANAVMGKIYDVLTNGDDTVPKSADNFFSWMTPGVPVNPSDFDFLVQGLTGVVPASSQNLSQAQINPAQPHRTNGRVVQAQQQSRQGGFAATGAPEHSKHRACRHQR